MSYKMVGVTDDTTTCELCGKKNLKRVIVLEDLSNGNFVRYGSDCASKVMALSGQNIKASVLDEDGRVLALINKWRKEGHSNETIIKHIRNKIGYGVEAKSNKIRIKLSTGMTEV